MTKAASDLVIHVGTTMVFDIILEGDWPINNQKKTWIRDPRKIQLFHFSWPKKSGITEIFKRFHLRGGCSGISDSPMYNTTCVWSLFQAQTWFWLIINAISYKIFKNINIFMSTHISFMCRLAIGLHKLIFHLFQNSWAAFAISPLAPGVTPVLAI